MIPYSRVILKITKQKFIISVQRNAIADGMKTFFFHGYWPVKE